MSLSSFIFLLFQANFFGCVESLFWYVPLTLVVCSYMQLEAAGYEKLPDGNGCCPHTGCSACTGNSLRSVIDDYSSDACSIVKLPSDCTSWKFVANALTSGTSSSVEKSPYGVYRLANSDNLATSTNNMYVHDKFWLVSTAENYNSITHWFTSGATLASGIGCCDKDKVLCDPYTDDAGVYCGHSAYLTDGHEDKCCICGGGSQGVEESDCDASWFATIGFTEETYPKCSLTENGWTDMWSVSAAKICKEGGQCDHENVVSGHCSGKGGWAMWHQAKPYPGNLCMTGTDISPCKFTGELKYIHACMAATCSSKKDAIVALHGSIENWDVSEVTTMANAFRGMVNFNSDIR